MLSFSWQSLLSSFLLPTHLKGKGLRQRQLCRLQVWLCGEERRDGCEVTTKWRLLPARASTWHPPDTRVERQQQPKAASVSPVRARKEIVGGLERDKALPKGFRVSQGLSAKGFLDTASRKSPYTPPWPHTVHVFLNAPCSLLSSGVPG